MVNWARILSFVAISRGWIWTCLLWGLFAPGLGAQTSMSPYLLPEADQRNPYLPNVRQARQTLLRSYYGTTAELRPGTFSSTDLARLQEQLQKLPILPQEGPVDPHQYRIGPGDVLQITIEAFQPPLVLPAVVSPQGLVDIPTVGAVSVSGLRLAEAQARLDSLLRRLYRSSVRVHLASVRSFWVHVVGAVPLPGRYLATPLSRLEEVVLQSLMARPEAARDKRELAQPEKPRPSDPETRPPTEETAQIPALSLRHIRIRHADGTESRADLLRYYLTGDLEANPYLRDGDVVQLSTQQLARGSISLSGAVHLPGTFEYAAGDSLRQILAFGLGFTAEARPEEALLLRPTERGIEEIRFDARAVLEGRAPNRALQPGDRIVIPRRPGPWQPPVVQVIGEVMAPGIYPIEPGRTRLQEVLRWTGGLTEEADLRSAYIVRRPDTFDPLWENPDYARLVLARTTALNLYGRQYVDYETFIRRDLVSADLENALRNGDAGPLLEPGDRIYIPKRQQTVFVFGQVSRPGHVPYRPGWSARDYVEAAGGFTDAARRSEVFVIEAGTFRWKPSRRAAVLPGDMIFVNRKELSDPYIAQLGMAQRTQVIASLVSLSVTLLSLALQLLR
ncbi:MAG: SLBB domain-containing protein [Bacteroidota bacterium]|nr:SLBB domain-containing protein [Bacteroidota bacterium]MDW8137679.1 SLBB domain-containing protein [Bacteroidota bacterium]